MKKLVFHLIEDAIRNVSGPFGVRLRRMYYRFRCKHFGAGVTIEIGVTIQQPQFVSLGDRVWIDKNVTIIAGPYRPSPRVKVVGSPSDDAGCVIIGDRSHVGIGTVIQGHAGVTIGDCFTSSAYSCIYSLSNDPALCRSGTTGIDACYLAASIAIGRNVWLGLHTVVVGADIGDDCFLKPFSVARGVFSSGWVLEGNPAKPIHRRLKELVET